MTNYDFLRERGDDTVDFLNPVTTTNNLAITFSGSGCHSL